MLSCDSWGTHSTKMKRGKEYHGSRLSRRLSPARNSADCGRLPGTPGTWRDQHLFMDTPSRLSEAGVELLSSVGGADRVEAAWGLRERLLERP